eukprot:jgi/Bigna1/143936/aug1.82_g18644
MEAGSTGDPEPRDEGQELPTHHLRKLEQAWRLERQMILRAWADRAKNSKIHQQELSFQLRNMKVFIDDERQEWTREVERLVKEKIILKKQLDSYVNELELHRSQSRIDDQEQYKAIIMDLKQKEKLIYDENLRLRQDVADLRAETEHMRNIRRGISEREDEKSPERIVSELRRQLVLERERVSRKEAETQQLQLILEQSGHDGKEGSSPSDPNYRDLVAERDALLKRNAELEAELVRKDNDIRALASHVREQKQRFENEKRQMISVFKADLAEALHSNNSNDT